MVTALLMVPVVKYEKDVLASHQRNGEPIPFDREAWDLQNPSKIEDSNTRKDMVESAIKLLSIGKSRVSVLRLLGSPDRITTDLAAEVEFSHDGMPWKTLRKTNDYNLSIEHAWLANEDWHYILRIFYDEFDFVVGFKVVYE